MKPNKPKRRPAELAGEASVYDGSTMVGVIERNPGAFVALDADGDRLGEFKTEKLAMAAILDAARVARMAAEATA